MSKVCRDCKVEKKINGFAKNKLNKDGRNNFCKSCRNAYARRYREQNQELIKQRQTDYYQQNKEKVIAKTRDYALRQKYGIGVEGYEILLASQGGKCAICDAESGCSGKNNLYVDHRHKTGNVRGLLCQKCNSAIGLMDDDPTLLRKATKYLEEASCQIMAV